MSETREAVNLRCWPRNIVDAVAFVIELGWKRRMDSLCIKHMVATATCRLKLCLHRFCSVLGSDTAEDLGHFVFGCSACYYNQKQT